MKKTLLLINFLVIILSCGVKKSEIVQQSETEQVNQLLNQWHKDVASFQFDAYFDKMTSDAVFVGTDASEVWTKNEFMTFSRVFFEKKQTWDFKPLERHIYMDDKSKLAWFDETLDTWMGVCRGSGVVVKTDNNWKIQHYVLSIVVPNEDVQAVTKLKKVRDSLYIAKFN
jgi:hypothetical protein